MRAIAHTALLTCVVFCFQAGKAPAQESGSWKVLGQAKIEQKTRSNSAVMFRPEWSIEQNNAELNQVRSQTVSAQISLPIEALGRLDLVDQPVRFSVPSRVYAGRVIAVILSPDRVTTLFVTIENKHQPGRAPLVDGETGFLSIGE